MFTCKIKIVCQDYKCKYYGLCMFKYKRLNVIAFLNSLIYKIILVFV